MKSNPRRPETPRPAAIRVRAATANDAETIHRFISELAAFENEPDAVEATPASLREQLSLQRPPFECLIAELEDEPAGFALFFANYSTWRGRSGVYLEDLYVTPAHRQKGVARALFRQLCKLAFERGAGRLELSVLNWNQRAIDFYRSLGAVPLGEWTLYRLTDRDLSAIADDGTER